MNKNNIDTISSFVFFQKELVLSFTNKYTKVKDFTWLLDFPKEGSIYLKQYKWKFLKHGSGLRFTRVSYLPNIVIDIHKYFSQPFLFDEWRLLQYLESLGKHIEYRQITLQLEKFILLGVVKKNKNDTYELL